MYSLITPYKCNICNGELVFVTDTQATIDYKRVIIQNQFNRQEFYNLLAKHGVDYLKCNTCGRQFYIDWSDNKWPEAIIQEDKLIEFFSS